MAGPTSGVCSRTLCTSSTLGRASRRVGRVIAFLGIAAALIVSAGAAPERAPVGTQPPPNRVGAADAVRWSALTNATVHTAPGKVLKHATVVMRDGWITEVLFDPATQAEEDAKPAAPAKPADDKDAKPGEGAATASPDDDEPGAKDKAASAVKDKADASGRAKAIPAPAGAKSIDATGLHVYAGFVEPYLEVEVARPEPEVKGAHWSARVTPQRRAIDSKGVDEGVAKSMRSMGYVAAVISPKGGIFRGQSAAVSLAQPESDLASARPPAYRNAVYQSVALDLTNVGGGAGRWPGYPDSQMGAIALVRQVLLDAPWAGGSSALEALTTETARLNNSSDRNLKQDFARPLPLLMNAEDELEIARVSKIAEEFGRPAMVLGSGMEFRRLDGVKASMERLTLKNPPDSKAGAGGQWKGSLILPLNFPEKPKIASVADAEDIDLRELMTWEQAPTNPRRVLGAGINAALTTAKLKDRSRFMANVREAIRHGLKPDDALAMLTTRPAEIMGLASELGTVEKGKRASVIVADGLIFAKKTKLRDVWIDGVRHEINAAPIKGEGFYDVKIVGDAGKDRIAISIDKDNGVSVRRWPATEDGRPAKEQKSRAKSSSLTEDRVTAVFDNEPFGTVGMVSISGIVERDDAGAITGFSGAGQWADGTPFRWTASKGDDPKPDRASRALRGVWEMQSVGGNPIPPGGPERLTITVGADGQVKLTSTPEFKDIEAEDDVARSEGVWFKFSREKLGATKGEIKVVAKVQDKTLVGTWKEGEAEALSFIAIRVGNLPKPEPKKADASSEPKNAGDAKAADGAPADALKDDGVSGSWSGTLTADAPGFPPGGVPISMTIKLSAGQATGAVEAMGQSAAATGSYDEGAKTLTLSVQPPAESDPPATAVLKVDGASASGPFTMGPTNASASMKRQSGAASGAGAKKDADGDKEEPADAPEELPGLPFGGYAVRDEQKPASTILIHNATVWTSGPAGRLENAGIIIVSGKIERVGAGIAPPAGPVPEGWLVIDAKGKHVTPGIIDAHSHTGISRGVNEGGQAVTAEVRIQDVTNPDAINWYRQVAGGVTSVLSLHGSANAIGGQSQVNKIRWGCASADDMHMAEAIGGIKFALGENPKGGNSSGEGSTYPQTRMGVEMQIRDRFVAAREYAAKREQKEGAPARDLELEAIAEVLAGKRLIHCHSYRQDEILMMGRVAQEFGFKLGTYTHVLEGYKVADIVRETSRGASGFADWWAFKVEVQDAIPGAFPIMHEQGVVVSFNSDSDDLARRMNIEAAKGEKYSRRADGVSTVNSEEALKWITINPARQLMIDQWVGSLEPGKQADVVIWSSDPLSAFSKVERTFVDGIERFSLERDQRSRQWIAKERARLIQKVQRDSPSKKPGRDGTKAGEAKPSDRKSPEAKPTTTPAETPKKPTNLVTRAELESELGASKQAAESAASQDALQQRGDGQSNGQLRAGVSERVPLIVRMNREATIARRELYLERLRRGFNPEDHRSGVCGCE